MTAHPTWDAAVDLVTNPVLREVVAERARQDAKWGEQNHPDLSPYAQKPWVHGPATYFYGLPPVEQAKQLTDADAAGGSCSWARIALEELTEAIDAADQGDEDAVRTEVIQLAAVCVQWAQAIDRRKATR
jgi:hypothetical protein